MRYNKKIYLVKVKDRNYDPTTGNYVDGGTNKKLVWADITDASDSIVSFVYGGIRQGALVFRIQGFVGAFDYIEYGDKKYQADYVRRTFAKTSFVCSEI